MRIEALTSLRFVAAFFVTFFHFGGQTTLALNAPWLLLGPQMVTFFFVLSGFVLTLSNLNKTTFSFRGFYIARISRLLPAYLMALGLMVIIGRSESTMTLRAELLNLFFMQAWFPPYATSVNSPGWSVSVEIFFYALFPYIVGILKSRKNTFGFIFAAAALVYFLSQAVLLKLNNLKEMSDTSGYLFHIVHYLPLSHLSSFLLGIAGGCLVVVHGDRLAAHESHGGVIVIFGITATGLALFFPEWIVYLFGGLIPAFDAGFFAPLFLFMIVSVTVFDCFMVQMLSFPFLAKLGRISYAYYILQLPVWLIFSSMYKAGNASEDQKFLCFVGVLLIASQLTYHLVECPLGNKIKKYFEGARYTYANMRKIFVKSACS
jgi:peptidoglycan/LPS O-acetylase OafA/YrhL